MYGIVTYIYQKKPPNAGKYTPPKINIEPENDGLGDDFPFQLGEFQVPC